MATAVLLQLFFCILAIAGVSAIPIAPVLQSAEYDDVEVVSFLLQFDEFVVSSTEVDFCESLFILREVGTTVNIWTGTGIECELFAGEPASDAYIEVIGTVPLVPGKSYEVEMQPNNTIINSGFGSLSSVGSVPLTLPPPPAIFDVTIESGTGAWDILFDDDTDMPDIPQGPCGDYLTVKEQNQIDLAGFDQLICSFTWKSASILSTTFVGQGIFLGPADVLSILPAAGIRRFSGISEVFPGSLGESSKAKAFDRTNVEGNNYTISSPDQFSICYSGFPVSLELINSNTLYSVPLDVSWHIFQDLEAGFDDQVFSRNTSEQVISIRPDELFPFVVDSLNRTLEVEAIVGRYAGTGPFIPVSTPPRRQIQITSDKIIPVYVDGVDDSSDLLFSTFDDIIFNTVVVPLSANCTYGSGGVGSPITFAWDVQQSSTSILTGSASQLTILQNAIASGFNYQVTLIASVSNSFFGSDVLPKTTVFTFDVPFADNVIVFIAGSTSIEALSSFVLDASASCNPNAILPARCDKDSGFSNTGLLEGLNDDDKRIALGWGGFSFFWGCDSGPSCPSINNFLGQLSQQSIVQTFPGLENGSYTFSFGVDEIEGPGYSSTIDFEVVNIVEDCFFPTVTVITQSPLTPNEGKPVTLFTEVNGFNADPTLSEVELLWSEPSGLLDGLTTSQLQNPNLFIPQLRLVGGESYTLTLTATAPCAAGDRIVSNQITLNVNSGPVAGSLTISPLSGIAGKDVFTLTTSGWIDENVPLQYQYEILFRAINEDFVQDFEFSASDSSVLVTRSSSSVVRSTLPFPANDTKLVILAIAIDALGAESKRIFSAATENVTVLNPFVNDDGSANVTELEQVDIVNEIRDLINSGAESDIPVFCASFASSLNAIGDESANSAAQNIREGCVAAVVDVVNNLEQAATATPDDIAQILASLDLLTQRVDQIQESTCSALLTRVDEIINTTETLLEALNTQGNGALAAENIPGSFSPSSVRTLSNLLDCLLVGNRTQETCEVIGLVQQAIETLARIENAVVAAGAETREVSGNGIGFSATRQEANGIGTRTGNITIPGFEREILLQGDLGLGNQTNEDLNIVVIRYTGDLRCERDLSFFNNINNTNDTECAETIYAYDGPLVDGIGNVLSLNFLSFSNIDQRPTVEDLDESSIVLELDAALDTTASYECDVNLIEFIACGAFNESTGDWETSGCTVLGVDTEKQTVTCQCNHATDYAAWKAFREDLSFTTGETIDKLSFIASLIIGLFLPLIYILTFLGWYWAHRRDAIDADNIRRSALASLIMFRIMRANKQRLFFKRLKEHAKEGKRLERVEKLSEPESFPFLRRLYLAVRFEHSVAGMSRFDPHYSRVQRVSVFLAVIVANLFVASILFELKDADDVSGGFLFGVVFVSAVAIAIPIKLVVKLLFKTSANPIGSSADVAANLFVLLERLEQDGSPESPEDRRLINAYKDATIADLRVKQAAEVAKSMRKSMKGLNSSSKLKKIAEEDMLEEGNADITEEVVHAEEVANTEEEMEMAEKQLTDAKEAFLLASQNVNAATLSARDHWKKAPTLEAIGRMRRVRRQRSTLMKLVAIASDRPRTVGKTRKPLFRSIFIYLGWFFTFLFYVGSTWYIVRFAALRKEYADSRPESESYYIILWLVTAAIGVLVSYVIAEPLVALTRYVILPYLVIKCGSEVDDDDEEEESKEEDSKLITLDVSDLENDEDLDNDTVDAKKMLPTSESTFIKTLKKKKKGVAQDSVLIDMLADLVEAVF